MSKFQLTATLLAVSLVLSSALADPQGRPGNPGIPGLLAEIEALEQELDETNAELEETEAELETTETELADTAADLAALEAELAALEAELAALQAELTAVYSELAATQAELTAALSQLAETAAELLAERQRYRVPRTGQDECYESLSKDPDEPHFTVHCDLTGQDGDARAGLAPPNARFTDNGNGTVTDNFTQLVWLKNAGCNSASHPDWETALNHATALPGTTFALCGLGGGSVPVPGDWRLPNVNELTSLLDYGASTTSGTGLPDGHPFLNFAGYYWTSTTFGLSSDRAVSQIIYPCRRQGYPDSRERFNDAYVVNIKSGEVVRLPKASGPDINKRHRTSGGGSCTGVGFRIGSPSDSPYGFPAPRFIAVANAPTNE